MSDELAVWIRDELLLNEDNDAGLDFGYLSGDPAAYAFALDGFIDVKQLADSILEHIATKIDELAEAEARRSGWDGMAGPLGNWVHGIREGARFIRRGLVDDPRYTEGRPG